MTTEKSKTPSHYSTGTITPWEYADANKLNGHELNIIKYITRYPYKGKRLEDLQKAKHCIEHLIELEIQGKNYRG